MSPPSKAPARASATRIDVRPMTASAGRKPMWARPVARAARRASRACMSAWRSRSNGASNSSAVSAAGVNTSA
jgi:hypothetical protein